MVRLIGFEHLFTHFCHRGFNSKMVRLIDHGMDFRQRGYRFQFQNGSINSWFKKGESNKDRRFNSKMVRLIVSTASAKSLSIDRFQFQNGSINSQSRIVSNDGKVLSFNSKMVRLIGDDDGLKPMYILISFNSKMVRLIAPRRVPFRCERRTFQFQNGSINSNRPRLLLPLRIGVSIPKWFD